ncbi:DUF1580 domain-containing protein [Rhodopirellula halodulae]|nr:DUF1580 domain-containing protein [Rhodopirellula sp. JC740]
MVTNQATKATDPLALLTEDIVSMSEAAKLFPGGVSVASIYRWADRGVKGVCLETVRYGSKRQTSVQAVHRFLKRTQ